MSLLVPIAKWRVPFMEIIIITVMVPLVIIITILFPTDPTNMSARILPLVAGTRPNVMDFRMALLQQLPLGHSHFCSLPIKPQSRSNNIIAL